MSLGPPPATVLSAFAVTGPPHPVTGGQGTSWGAGGLVFKPETSQTYEWLAQALAEFASGEVRIARAASTQDGSWSAEGWSATHRGRGPRAGLLGAFDLGRDPQCRLPA